MRAIAFAAGLILLFNFFIGAGSQAEGVVGGYGYRASDFFALICVFLLGLSNFNSAKLPSVLWYVLACLCVLVPVLFTGDRQTATLAFHFFLYSLAGLYIATLLSRGLTAYFCWGMIAGLAITLFVFLLVDLGVPVSDLASLGLAAGYAGDYGWVNRAMPRYSGLWGHPNDASHVAALASAAGAYLLLARKSVLAVVLVAACLFGVFYFTLSRGGLMIGGAVLALAVLLQPGRGIKLPAIGLCAAIVMLFVSQFSDVTARFTDNVDAGGNLSERLDSMLAAIPIIVAHPFGQPIVEFQHALERSTLVVATPHNGFLFLAGILGIPALLIFLAALGTNLLHTRTNVFVAALCVQIIGSFLFEQLSGNRSYIFAMGIIIGTAYLRSPFGAPLLRNSPPPQSGFAQLSARSGG